MWTDIAYLFTRKSFKYYDVSVFPLFDLSQDKDRWWVLVSAVMNIEVPETVGNFLIS